MRVKIASTAAKKSKPAVLLAAVFLLLAIVWLAIPDSARADLSDSLVGEWKLDEGSGTTVADSSANGNDGTIVQTGTSPAWVSPGHDGTGSALQFDGTGAHAAAANTVNLGNSATLDQIDNYTMSVWVKFDPVYVGGGGQWANLVGRNSSGADWAYMIYVHSSGIIRPHHRQSDGAARFFNSATVMPVGEWVHIEQVADGSNLRLYINGVEDANSPLAYSGTTMSLPSANTYIGQDTREFAPLATISDVSIYNAALTAPGGVRAGLSAWQRADDGAATGALWGDSSTNNNDAAQATVADQPTFQTDGINFNPAFQFDGTSDFMANTTINHDPTISGEEYFGAVLPNVGGFVTEFLGLGNQANTQNAIEFRYLNDALQFGAAPSFTAVTNPATSAGRAQIANAHRFSDNSTPAKLLLDGAEVASGNVNSRPTVDQMNIGARRFQANNDFFFNGQIAETIFFNRELTATERQKVASYLAIKYGITLDQTTPQDYLASDGATTPWNATEGGVYNSDIAGIGRDDSGALNQKQSKSINTSALVTIGNGTIAATNADNPNDFASDNNFLTWGNDDAPTDTTVVVDSTPLARMERIWKAQETGTVGTVKLRIPQSDLIGTSPTLLVSNDATFDSTDQQIALTTSGSDYEADVNLTDGQFFSFAIDSTIPEVTTDAATSITSTSATLNGELDTLGHFTPADVFFRYRIAGSGDPFTETTPQTLNAPGPFSANIGSLDVATQYEFLAVVQWQNGGTQEAEGTTLNFTTLATVPDAVVNLQAVAAGTSQIDLSWDAPADDGGSPITGYQIERSPNGTDSWTTIVPDTGNTDITHEDTGLNSNTQYFYRVSAINSAGTGSPSNVASATTDTLEPQITTDAATSVAQIAATLNGTLDTLGDFTPVDVFFRYRVQGSANPFTETAPQQLTAPGPFSVNLTGLDPDTTYEFKTVVQWEDGGAQQSEGTLATFTTIPEGNGIPECTENFVDCFVNPVTGTNVILEVDDACTINAAEMKPETDLNISDPDFEYPVGLMDFVLDCGTPGYTTTIKQYYFDTTNDNYVLRKHNPSTNAYFTIEGASIEQTVLGGQIVTIATYQATDGGELDIDGEVNGTIVDPAGLALSPENSDLADTGQNIWIPASIAGLLVAVSLVVMRARRAAGFIR